MGPPNQPGTPRLAHDRSSTFLETDEEVMEGLRRNLARSSAPVPLSPGQPEPTAASMVPTGTPTARQAPPPQSKVAVYRPTLRPPIAVLTVCDDGKSDGEQFRLRDGGFVIGRTEGDLVIGHDGMISSRHVEITRQSVAGQQRWVITDLQSTNGLFVRVSRTLLADQSELVVGKGRYRLLAPGGELAQTADHVPLEHARRSTQAWGADARAPGIPTLAEVLGNSLATRVPLLASEYWIGTDPSCAICRPNDPFCEPRHARLTRNEKGTWQVEQGVAVNGLWFRVPQVVCENSVQFQIGEQRFRLRMGG
jgi:pSer/pThr/pTyr-binding forkhead associated (FHA) protein